MSDECAYRSTDPEVAEAWQASIDATRAWSRAANEMSHEHGFGGRFITLGAHLAGFPPPTDGTVPEGWRVEQGRGRPYLVPDKRRKIGKEAAARIAEIGASPTNEDLLGMPDQVWVPKEVVSGPFTHDVNRPMGIVLVDGAVWCRWQVSTDRVEATTRTVGVTLFQKRFFDATKWERVKLSEYHVAKERADEADEAEIAKAQAAVEA